MTFAGYAFGSGKKSKLSRRRKERNYNMTGDEAQNFLQHPKRKNKLYRGEWLKRKYKERNIRIANAF
jgi:hypothetical protein